MNGRKANRTTGGGATTVPSKATSRSSNNVQSLLNCPNPSSEGVMGSSNAGTLGPYQSFRAANGATPQTNGSTSNSSNNPPVCAGCSKNISERYLLKALDQLWHEDCLKCSCCECRLGEVGSTLYIKANLILCKRDYLRLFGSTGICSACNKTIPAFEMVMRAKGNNYHLECFACQRCNHRFCVGDKFYLLDNRILCEYDYEEVVSRGGHAPLASVTNASMGANGASTASNSQNWCSSLEKLKKQTESIDTNTTGHAHHTQLMSH